MVALAHAVSQCNLELGCDSYVCMRCPCAIFCAACKNYFQQAVTMHEYPPFKGMCVVVASTKDLICTTWDTEHNFDHDMVRVNLGVACSGCLTQAFLGDKFTCTVCKDVVLCEACMEDG